MPKARRQMLAAARAMCLDSGALWFRDLLATARAELPGVKIEKLSDLPDEFLQRIVAGRVDVPAAGVPVSRGGSDRPGIRLQITLNIGAHDRTPSTVVFA